MVTTTIVPIKDQQRLFTVWNIIDIYTGTGKGQYVPNVNDAVWDWEQGLFKVIGVDYSTGLSTLQKYKAPKDASSLSDEDILLGAGPGAVSESYRAFLDTSVMPHTLALDSRLHVYGTTNSYVKIFKGTDIGSNGEVISAFYDQQGTLLGENIPLELVAMNNAENLAIKTPMVGYTKQKLSDGEVVTAVVYDDAGQQRSVALLLIKNSAFVRTTDASKKYITSVSLESPFLSASNPKLMEVPINLPLEGINMQGVINYSDGSKRRLNIDGTRFSLYGLDNYVATILGQNIPIVLSYKMASDEFAYGITTGENRKLTERYAVSTIKADGAYSVKLYVYPVWIDELNGYRLEYFLYNLDREKIYYATPYVSLGSNSKAFDPLSYGVNQEITVAVDLSKVDGRFSAFRHVQTFSIALLGPGNETRDNWSIQFSSGQNPPYGLGLKAAMTFVNVNYWKVDISCGFKSQEEWLRNVFYNTQPLFDPDAEVEAPAPNFFRMVFGSRKLEFAISQWSAESVVANDLKEGEVLFLEFFKRTQDTDLELGCSGLVVHQTT